MPQKHKKPELCPICGVPFDGIFYTSHRNTPFVDDKCYARMCFGCFWTPKRENFTYDEEGAIAEVTQLPYSHKYLLSPEELLESAAVETLRDARRCVRRVRGVIKAAGLDGRKKGKPKKKPVPQVELTD